MQNYAGIGLRPPHYQEVLDHKTSVGWFEVISENFIDTEGRPLWVLERVRQTHPIGLHGVSLNIGSPDPVNRIYLQKLKTLIRRIQPNVVSDHLCWGGVEGRNWHDLLPLPMTEAVIDRLVEKIDEVQTFLGRRIVLENASAYLRFKEDEMSEAEFITEVAERADCYLLLDINNVYVNAFNHGFDARQMIREIPAYRVVQYHLAGHTNAETFLFDTHDRPVEEPVWDLFRFAVEEVGPRPFIIERDENIPALTTLEAEARRAEAIVMDVMKESYVDTQEQANVDSRL